MSDAELSPVWRLQRMMAHACFSEDAPARFDGDLRGYLEAHGLHEDDVEALLSSPRRLGLYRKLVRHNPRAIVETMLTRTRALMDRCAPGVFARTVDGFLHHAGPRTAHLRDVPREFLDWARARWDASPDVPRWMNDFAEVEHADFTVGVAPRRAEVDELRDIEVDRQLVFTSEATLLRLRFAVHLLDDATDALPAPEERGVALLVYRDDAHVTRFFELSELAGAIVERLLHDATLMAALTEACREGGRPLDASVLEGTTRLLAELGERGVLLGARDARRPDERT